MDLAPFPVWTGKGALSLRLYEEAGKHVDEASGTGQVGKCGTTEEAGQPTEITARRFIFTPGAEMGFDKYS